MLRTGYGIFYAKTTNSTYYATRVENGVYQQTFSCASPSDLPGPDVSQRDLDSARTGAGRAVRRRPDAAGGHLHAARRHPGNARHVSRLGQSADPRGRRHRGAPVAGRLSGSVAYVVSRGLHLPIFFDANLAPSTTTKTYDILNSSGATTQTYTVPFYTSRINTNTGEVFVGYERRQFLV